MTVNKCNYLISNNSFKISGGTGTTSAISGDALTINLDNTAVSGADYGSSTAMLLPWLKVVSERTSSKYFNRFNSNDDGFHLAFTCNDSFKIAGGTGLGTSISGDVLTLMIQTQVYQRLIMVLLVQCWNTVSSKGRITSVSTASVSGDLTIVDDSSTSSYNIGKWL